MKIGPCLVIYLVFYLEILARPHLKVSGEKLCPSQTQAPVFFLIPDAAHNQVASCQAALLPQALGQFRVDRFLLLKASALLEDLDDDYFVGSLVAEIGIFTDNLVRFMLCNDLASHVSL